MGSSRTYFFFLTLWEVLKFFEQATECEEASIFSIHELVIYEMGVFFIVLESYFNQPTCNKSTCQNDEQKEEYFWLKYFFGFSVPDKCSIDKNTEK